MVGRQECRRPRTRRQDESALFHPRQQERRPRAGAQEHLLRKEHRQRARQAPEIVGGLRDDLAARVLVRLATAADEVNARRGRRLRGQHRVESEHAARPHRLLEAHQHDIERRRDFPITLLRVVELLLPGIELLAPVGTLLRIELFEQLARLGEHAEFDVGTQQVVAHGETVRHQVETRLGQAHQQFGVAAVAEIAAQLHEQIGGRRLDATQRLFIELRRLARSPRASASRASHSCGRQLPGNVAARA